MLRQLLFVLGIAALFCSTGVSAVMIDDFEVGDFSVTDSPALTPTEQEISGIPTANTAGGVRAVKVFATGNVAVATFSLVTTPLDDSALMATAENGLFNLYYDGIANGIEDNRNGILNLDMSGDNFLVIDATVPAVGPTVRVTLWTAAGSDRSNLETLEVGGPTLIDLSIFALDLSDIHSIRLQFSGFAALGAGSPGVTLQSIYSSPVPEPGTALLLGLGLIGLGARRRFGR